MRVELMRLHQKLSATMIYVTHDQVEAMTLADRIAVLNKGVLQQVGPPSELYDRPANLFVAGFIGTPKMNVVDAPLAGKAGLLGELPPLVTQIGVRAESVQLGRAQAVVGDGTPGIVDVVEHLGYDALVHLSMGGFKLVARVEAREAPRPGERVRVTLPPSALHAFAADGMRVELEPPAARRERA
jgi:ABC-type sugar transport system ATPase subunit